MLTHNINLYKDDYTITSKSLAKFSMPLQIEEEKILQRYKLIDVVVLTNAALVHSRVKPDEHYGYGFEKCFNYLVINEGSRNRMALEDKQEIMSLIPNQTVESKAWYKELVKNDEPIGVQVKSMQRLALYWRIAMVSSGIINGDIQRGI